MQIPYFTKEQVDYLNKLYPESCPSPEDDDRKIWMKVGQRTVVRHINRVYEEQIERSVTRS